MTDSLKLSLMISGKLSIVLMIMAACAQTKDSQTQTADINGIHGIHGIHRESEDTTGIGVNELYLLESYLHDQPLDTTLVKEIDFDCAVLVYPNDEQIQQMKSEYGEEDFYIIADDNNWYQAKSTGLLDSAKVLQVTPERRFVRFVGKERSWTLNLRRKGALAWNLIFFNRNKKPEVISTVDLTIEEINLYFDK